MTWLLLGLLLFVASHIWPTLGDTRARLVARFGDNGYAGLHTLASLIGVVLMVYGYGAARAVGTPTLYDPPFALRHVVHLLMLPVFPMIFAAFTNGHIKATLKHPMLAGFKLWAFAHLLVNGTLADVVLFGGLLAWAVYARISLKRRGKLGGTATPHAKADIVPVIAGLAVYGLFVWRAHLWLIGVPVM